MTTTADREAAFEYATRALKYGAPWDAFLCRAYLSHCERIESQSRRLAEWEATGIEQDAQIGHLRQRCARLESELARACRQHEAAASKLWDSEQRCAQIERETVGRLAESCSLIAATGGSAMHCVELLKSALASINAAAQADDDDDECAGGNCSHRFDAGGGEHYILCEKHGSMNAAEQVQGNESEMPNLAVSSEPASAAPTNAAEQGHESLADDREPVSHEPASAALYFPPCRGSIERREAEINAAAQANPRSSVQEQGASPVPAPAAAPRGVDASTWLQMQAQGQAFTTTERTLGIIEGLEIAEKIAQSYCFSAFRTVVDSVVTAIRYEIDRRTK